MQRNSRSLKVAFVGLTVALLAVSAWVSIPLGPVPFTLQTFVLAFAILVLSPGECLAAVGAYLLLGAVGVPVFSGMRGGLGMLAGSSGGFLWGFLLGALVALALLRVLPGKKLEKRSAEHKSKGTQWLLWLREFVACLGYLLVSYVCGWVQLTLVAGLDPLAAFIAGIAPFVVVDIAKLVAAVAVARAVCQALPALKHKRAV